MRLHQDFIVYREGESTLLVPTAEAAFHGVVRGNRTVSAILECLQEDTDEEAIVRALCDRFDGSEAEIRSDVNKVLSDLRGIGAITES